MDELVIGFSGDNDGPIFHLLGGINFYSYCQQHKSLLFGSKFVVYPFADCLSPKYANFCDVVI